MGFFIKSLVDSDVLRVLTPSNPNPTMIRQDGNIARAVKEFIGNVKSLTLYPDYQTLVDQFELLQKSYPVIYSHRVFFVWQVGQAAYQLSSLNLQDTDYLHSNSLKCRIGLITILLDDICDMGHDQALFQKCILALHGDVDRDEAGLYQIFTDTWATLQDEIAHTPNYDLLKTIFEEATQAWIESFEYSLWLENTSRVDEKWERHLEIISHSGTIYLAGLLDLLFLPNLSTKQITAASEVFLRTQKMVQIPNWLASWEREFTQRDFTSGVFSMALENCWVTWDDLQRGDIAVVRQKIQNSPVESRLWNEWNRLRVEAAQIVKDENLKFLSGYLDGFSVIMFMQLASSGII